MPPNKERVFLGLCEELLDFGYTGFQEKCAQWGLEQYAQLERHDKILVDGNASDKGCFIYGVAFAVIVGEFGERAFNNYFSESDHEIDLAKLGFDFRDIEGYVEEDMKAERRKQLQQYSCVELQDVWSALWEWKKEIYKSLVFIYKEQHKGETDPTLPDYAIYESLLKIFEEKDEETGEMVGAYPDSSQKIAAYSYVSGGFQE